jgi:hypothetical protein
MKSINKTDIITAANSRFAKYQNICRFIWPHVKKRHKYNLCIIVLSQSTLWSRQEAETMANDIYNEWFCKFGMRAQIHKDGGEEFVNK